MRLRWCCAGHVGKRMSCGYEASGVVLGMWGRE